MRKEQPMEEVEKQSTTRGRGLRRVLSLESCSRMFPNQCKRGFSTQYQGPPFEKNFKDGNKKTTSEGRSNSTSYDGPTRQR